MQTHADGYEFELAIRPGPGPKPVGISFWQEVSDNDDESGALYGVAEAGSFVNRRMNLDLRTLGSVRARFAVTSETRRVRHHGRHCTEVAVTREGRFEGQIDVEGENGFAAVHRTRIPGRVKSYRIRGCNRHGKLRTRTGGPALLIDAGPGRLLAGSLRYPAITSCGTQRKAWFGAFRGPDGAEYGATLETRQAGIHAIRVAFSVGTRASFRVAADQRHATVEPDAHYFSGRGRYADGQLTGDLAADFPGLPATSLTPADAEFGSAADVGAGACFPFSGD